MSKRNNSIFVLVAVAIVMAGGIMAIGASNSANDGNNNTTANLSADDVEGPTTTLFQILPYAALGLAAAVILRGLNT